MTDRVSTQLNSLALSYSPLRTSRPFGIPSTLPSLAVTLTRTETRTGTPMCAPSSPKPLPGSSANS